MNWERGDGERHGPTVGLVLVMRDEARFLREHLLYHRRLGVTRCYAFLDRCSDATEEIAAAFPWVMILHRDRGADERHMSSYQLRCMREGMERALADGLDWLMHIDPDEFARADDPYGGGRFLLPRGKNQRAIEAAMFPPMLAQVGAEMQQVVMRPLDVVSTRLPKEAPFHALHYFQNRGALRRKLLDPATGVVRDFRKRIGHYKGKSIVRVGTEVQPVSAHLWEGLRGEALPTIRRGLHYHFVAVDGDLWWQKHRKYSWEPDRWQKGNPVRFPKQAWKAASANMSLDEARDYFERWLVVEERTLWRHLLTGAVVRDEFISRVLADAKQESARGVGVD